MVDDICTVILLVTQVNLLQRFQIAKKERTGHLLLAAVLAHR
jgi:hypothetical protein